MSKKTTTSLAKMLQVPSDPTRLAILDLLMQRVQFNCELGDKLQLPGFTSLCV